MKKILAMVLAIMMMVVPTMSLAANTVNISMQHGTALEQLLGASEMTDAINQLIDMIGLNISTQMNGEDGQVSMSLTLGEAEVANLQVAKIGDEMYAASNVIGSDVVVINKDEMAALGIPFDTMDSANLEELDFSDIDLTDLMAAIAPVLEKMEAAEVTEQPAEDCDKAVSKITLNMTTAELYQIIRVGTNSILKSNAVQEVIKSLENAGAEVNITEMPENSSAEGTVQVEAYLDAESMPVYVLATITNEKSENNTATAEYKRSTDNGAVNNLVNVLVADDDHTLQMVVQTEIIDDNNGSFILMISENVNDKDQTMTYVGTVSGDENGSIAIMTFELEDGEDSMGFGLQINERKNGNATHTTVEVTALDLEEVYFTLVVDTDEVADAPSIATADAVHVLSLSEEELQSFAENVSQNAMMRLIVVMQALPAEVLNLMMQ